MNTSADAINSFGVALLTKAAKPAENALISPYSIQSALAMTCAGASGATRAEMIQVLRYPEDEAKLHRSFAALRQALDDVGRKTADSAERMRQFGITNDPVTLAVANRLFGQAGYNFRPEFLALTKERYNAPFEALDFGRNPAAATRHINGWVGEQTQQRIRNLIPALDASARLVLVNAIYLKAPWAREFPAYATKPLPFYVAGDQPVDVPTMRNSRLFGYGKRDGLSLVSVPYMGEDLQFVILLPDRKDGLAALENSLTAGLLAECARLPQREVVLYLPRLKLEPPLLTLSKILQEFGMKTAFDQPRGSANFDRIAPRHDDDYLCISEVFHKTFLKLDEKGTEAAAATAVAMVGAAAMPSHKPEPIEVRVDHPFLFAIQHRASGACLFLGRITDPR